MPPIPRPPLDRLMTKYIVDDATGCWNWTAFVDTTGYGLFRMPGGTTQAHRAAYVLLVGPVPDGLQIDHLCKNKRCINPSHLEAVTPRVNTNRARRTPRDQCRNGHDLRGENGGDRSDGKRYCKTCHRESEYVKQKARRAAAHQA